MQTVLVLQSISVLLLCLQVSVLLERLRLRLEVALLLLLRQQLVCDLLVLMHELAAHHEDVAAGCHSCYGLTEEQEVPLWVLLLSVVLVRQVLHRAPHEPVLQEVRGVQDTLANGCGILLEVRAGRVLVLDEDE